MSVFRFQDKEIYYETYGEGEPLILLNGIMMSCASWTYFIDSFSAGNRLILLDMLDQGKSSKMTEEFTHDIQVEVVKALLDELEIEQVWMFGISYGGEIAMQFAIKYQSYVKRLLLFNTTAWTSPWLCDVGDAWNAAACDGEAYYNTTIPVIYSPQFYIKHNEWIENRKKALIPVFNTPAFIQSMIRLTNSSKYYDCRAEISQIKVPVLVVSSEYDFVTPKNEQEYIVSQLEDVSYVMIPDSGHASMYEQPMLFASLIMGFVNALKSDFNIV